MDKKIILTSNQDDIVGFEVITSYFLEEDQVTALKQGFHTGPSNLNRTLVYYSDERRPKEVNH